MSSFAFLKSMFGGGIEKKSILLSDSYDLICAAPTYTGAPVNAVTAMRVPAVFSAVVLISSAIGSLPAKVFLQGDDGKEAAKGHPAYRLVHDEANDWTSAGELRRQLTEDALRYDHGGFAFANRVDGRVVEFIRLDPRTVTVKTDDASGEPFYDVQEGTKVKRYGYRDILHIVSPLGGSPITFGREAIALASTLEKRAAQLFANGARPSGVLSNENNTGGGENQVNRIDNMRKAWNKWMSGSNDPLFLDGGWKYASATMTSTDAQFHEMRRFQTEEIARLFRVPPTMLFDLTRGTWSNTEQMRQQFLELTLRPWLDAWEWAYARCLLTPEERAAGHYIEFVTDDLLTVDFATRATAYGQYRAMGVMTANEVRAGLNLPRMEGGDTLDNPNITVATPAGENDNREPNEAAA